MTALSHNVNALEYASKDLRGDRDIVMTAVKEVGWALYFASGNLIGRGDRDGCGKS